MKLSKWKIFHNEAAVAAEMIAAGVTTLGKANLRQPELYYVAFFQLSIGFERVGKIVYIADFSIEHLGEYPSQEELRTLGHNIKKIFDVVNKISLKWRDSEPHSKQPDDSINNGIIDTLTRFGKSSRYYNLDNLTGVQDNTSLNPIADWYEHVAIPILKSHSNEKVRSSKLTKPTSDQSSGDSSVRNRSITADGTVRCGGVKYEIGLEGSNDIQRWGRMYTMQIARWLKCLIDRLAYEGAYERKNDSLLGLDVFFRIFGGSDAHFKRKKTWTIRP